MNKFIGMAVAVGLSAAATIAFAQTTPTTPTTPATPMTPPRARAHESHDA